MLLVDIGCDHCLLVPEDMLSPLASVLFQCELVAKDSKEIKHLHFVVSNLEEQRDGTD